RSCWVCFATDEDDRSAEVGCARAAAAAPPSGSTRPACSAGWTRSSGATARPAWPVHSATQSTSSSSPRWVSSPP
ncbi:unnamed protein product, partial [Tetraodon nigroviridis]